jgi:hypothetical protein
VSDNVGDTVAGLQADGQAAAIAAFRKALGNVESVAKDLCPVGHYKRSRGKSGKSGGDLKQSLVVAYMGLSSNQLIGRCISALAYAGRQHDQPFHHPGLYTGSPGEVYASKFFERGVAMVFGSGNDPLGKFSGSKPATFAEILKDG